MPAPVTPASPRPLISQADQEDKQDDKDTAMSDDDAMVDVPLSQMRGAFGVRSVVTVKHFLTSHTICAFALFLFFFN